MNLQRPFRRSLLTSACALAFGPVAHAAGGAIRFLVVDPSTGAPVPGFLLVKRGTVAEVVETGTNKVGESAPFDPATLNLLPVDSKAKIVRVPLGQSITLQQQKPVKTITITVTATRVRPNAPTAGSSGTVRDRSEIQKFINTTQADTKQLTKGQAGVTQDSAGQQHVRGEHTEITYVVDDVPLPDTLSGRQGSMVVPSTIDSIDIITGGFAPEFGGQTAAVLNIATLPTVKTERDLTLQAGSYNTMNGDLTATGHLGSRIDYVLDLNANSTENLQEPNQPGDQTAHNHGSSESGFAKVKYKANEKDTFSLSVNASPDQSQIPNRTGLPASFVAAGQGYGFEGLRNADGTVPITYSPNPNAYGSQTMVLPSQQADGMDINQRESSEFATLTYNRKMDANDAFMAAFTLLHSGQDLTNNNPAVDGLNLPVDNSIEYNPTVSRNIHQVQGLASMDMHRGNHRLKFGVILDTNTGNETYNVQPASRLALDALAALDPALAQAGTSNPNDIDIDGNPVFTPTSGTTPTIHVHRSDIYQAAYVQDTWQLGRLTSNYGMRFDRYASSQTGGGEVDASMFSPRLNFQYKLDRLTDLRWSYDRLFNTPPLAQGAIVGEAIQPETLSQYDVGITRKVKKNETATLAYYYKDIRNQVDVGLLIPGSEIGLYSAVNFQRGAVHGIEFSYDVSAPKGVGWDEFFNYTYSAAMPNGLDNTGAPAPDYNDHDQRQTIGAGAAYSWKSGASAALTFDFGSGLASSIIPPTTERHPRHEFGLHATTGDRLWHGRGGLSLDIENILNSTQVINFQSGFSGTRFEQGRRILLSTNYKF
jgi:outer membrane receptor protein involved in Fe transport